VGGPVENLFNYGGYFLLAPDELGRDGMELVQSTQCVVSRLLEDVLDGEVDIAPRFQVFS
jgi:hypothetical protein